MKIALLGAANSVHLARIANEILAKGYEVIVISLPNHIDNDKVIKAKIFYLKYSGGKGYYLNALELKRILKEEKVDVLNSHYASGYGTLGRLSGFHPTVLSVWGSDVYSFPKENRIKKIILKKNLKNSDLLFSTSNCMANETRKYIGDKKKIVITPFGVDTEMFCPSEKKKENSDTNFVIGFLKGTSRIYGIDLFMVAFEKSKKTLGQQGIFASALICGGGDRYDEIISKIKKSEFSDSYNFLGRIPHAQMPQIISECDVVCVPSLEESFGVVALEAMSSGIPCITSDAPGLAEVVNNEITGYVTNNTIEELSEKICILAINCEKRRRMSAAAREHVCKEYDFSKNIDIFLDAYISII